MSISVYVNAPDCSCGHPQDTHYCPGAPRGCRGCSACLGYDGVIETLGVGHSPDKLYPAVYDEDGFLILPPELIVPTITSSKTGDRSVDF